MTHENFETTAWRRSSYSATRENCVEVAQLPRQTAVRDSKDPDGPALAFGKRAFTAFLATIRQHDWTSK